MPCGSNRKRRIKQTIVVGRRIRDASLNPVFPNRVNVNLIFSFDCNTSLESLEMIIQSTKTISGKILRYKNSSVAAIVKLVSELFSKNSHIDGYHLVLKFANTFETSNCQLPL